jgi:GMP synthase (glutamine-hydrolysing)
VHAAADALKARSAAIILRVAAKVYDPERRAASRSFGLGLPVLGICYGEQLMAHQLGGKVETATSTNTARQGHGRRNIGVLACFARGEELAVWMSHGDRLTGFPRASARSRAALTRPLRIANPERKLWHQFHRGRNTPRGVELRVLFDVAGYRRADPGSFVDEAVAAISARAQRAGDCGLSGGVDSSVAAVLVTARWGIGSPVSSWTTGCSVRVSSKASCT